MRRRRYRTGTRAGLLLAACWLVLLGAVAGCDADSREARGHARAEPLRLGVQSWSMSAQVARQFASVERALEHALARRDLPRDITVEPFAVHGELLAALVGGRVDVARLEPASYLAAHQREPEIALIAVERPRRRAPPRGMIFTAKRSSIQRLAGLRGRTFAFGDEHAAIGRHLPQAALVDSGLRASDLRAFAYLQHPDKVAAAVRLGEFDAGVVDAATFRRANRDRSLRILARLTDAPRPWAARAGLEPGFAAAFGEALRALADAPALAALEADGFERADPDAYAQVREAMATAARFEAGPGTGEGSAPASRPGASALGSVR